jgi:hypothetical protein
MPIGAVCAIILRAAGKFATLFSEGGFHPIRATKNGLPGKQ